MSDKPISTAVITFRDRLRLFYTPPWLVGGVGEKLLYSFGLQVDAFADALVAGVKARFPGLYFAESLPFIGRERRIARGPYETDSVYATRLPRWLDDHRTRGGPYALLAQLYAFYAPNNFPIVLIYRNGRRYRMDAAGVVVRDDTSFAPDTSPDQWARWWLFFETDLFDTVSPSDADIATLSLVPREWNAAHTQGTLIVLPTNAELWNYPLGRIWNDPGKTWNISGDPALTIAIP